MNEIWKTLGKYVTFGVIPILLYFGVDLLSKAETNTSTAAFAGAGLIFIGIALSVLFFADWKKMEGYEHLIKQQADVIRNLSAQIRETAKTHSAQEQQTRDDLAGSTLNSKSPKYKPDAGVETPDSL